MRSFLVCVVLALAISCAAAQQTRPKLSETFESKGFVQIKHNGTLFFGEGTHPLPLIFSIIAVFLSSLLPPPKNHHDTESHRSSIC